MLQHHTFPKTMPKPRPEASVHKLTLLAWVQLGSMNSALPFHSSQQAGHQWMSSVASWGTATCLSMNVMSAAALNRRLTNVRPGGTALAANDSKPARDKSSRFEHDDFTSQALNSNCSSPNFAAGRRSSPQTVSNSTPKNVRTVDGGHILSSPSARGIPSLANTDKRVLKVVDAVRILHPQLGKPQPTTPQHQARMIILTIGLFVLRLLPERARARKTELFTSSTQKPFYSRLA